MMPFTKTTQSEDHTVVSRDDLDKIEEQQRSHGQQTLRQVAAKLRAAEADADAE